MSEKYIEKLGKVQNQTITQIQWLTHNAKPDRKWENMCKGQWQRFTADTCCFMDQWPKVKITTNIIFNNRMMGILNKRCNRIHAHTNIRKEWIEGQKALEDEIKNIITRDIQSKIGIYNATTIKDKRDMALLKTALQHPAEQHQENIASSGWEILKVTEKAAYDDITGLSLDRGSVIAARQKEMEYIKSMGVWAETPREEVKQRKIPVIKARWIDINKGDDKNPLYRSRYVAKEYKTGETMENAFAATPPHWKH